MQGHASHQDGKDVDIRPMRNDGVAGPTNYQSSNYSRQLTQQLVNIILQDPNVELIWFNDPNITGVTAQPGHDHHLHVKYKN